MTNNVKQEAKRLYSCVMHDFHDNKERQEMWEREIQLVINQQVVQALERVVKNYDTQYQEQAKSAGIERVTPSTAFHTIIDNLIKEYKDDNQGYAPSPDMQINIDGENDDLSNDPFYGDETIKRRVEEEKIS